MYSCASISNRVMARKSPAGPETENEMHAAGGTSANDFPIHRYERWGREDRRRCAGAFHSRTIYGSDANTGARFIIRFPLSKAPGKSRRRENYFHFFPDWVRDEVRVFHTNRSRKIAVEIQGESTRHRIIAVELSLSFVTGETKFLAGLTVLPPSVSKVWSWRE